MEPVATENNHEVLVARLIAISWLVTGHSLYYHYNSTDTLFSTFGLDLAHAGYRYVFGGSTTIAALFVLFSPRPLLGARALGVLILLSLVLSTSYFSNNLLFTSLILVFVSFRLPESDWLVRCQCGLVFFGAAFNKICQNGWRSGEFLSSFVTELMIRGNMWRPGGVGDEIFTLKLFGPTIVENAALLSYCVIFGEVALALAFLLKGKTPFVLMGIFFGLVAMFTGSTLGMFVYTGIALTFFPFNVVGNRRVMLYAGWVAFCTPFIFVF